MYRLKTLCLVPFVLISAFTQAWAATPDAAIGNPCLKTLVVPDYAPYSFANLEGKADGFSVDLIRAVAASMGRCVEVEVGPWANARAGLEGGRFDLLPMMAYSAERDKFFDFSTPHTLAYDALFVSEGAPPVRKLEELKGKRVAVLGRDIAHEYLVNHFPPDELQLISVPSIIDALRLLESRDADVALMPKLVGLALMRAKGVKGVDGSPSVVEAYNRPFSFAVKEGNLALVERLNQGLGVVKNSWEYKLIYDKWFGSLESKGIEAGRVLLYIGAVLVAAFAALFFQWSWSRSLKKQVESKTRELNEAMRVTEEVLRKEAQTEKQRALDLDTILNAIPVAVWIAADPSCEVITGNQAAGLALRLPHRSNMWLGGPVNERPVNVRVLKDGRELSPDEMPVQAAARGVVVSDYEFDFVFEDGEVRHMLGNAVPLLDPEGRPRGAVAAFVDISSRKEEQLEVLVSARRLKLALDSGRMAVWDWNLLTNGMVWDDRMFDLYGITPETFPSSIDAWLNGLHPEDKERAVAECGEAINGGRPFDTTFRVVHPSGEVRFIKADGLVLRDPSGKPIRMLGLNRDVTDLKMSEKALQETERKFRNYIEKSPDCVFVVDERGSIVDVNPALAEATGFTQDKLLKMTLSQVITPESLAAALEQFGYLKTSGVSSGEFAYRTSGGGSGWWSIAATKLSDTRYLVFAKDITERKLAESALEKRIIALTRPLEDATHIAFDELFNLADLQRMQDDFSRATGVASIITNPDGTPITEPSNFCRLCSGIIRETEEGRANCYRSDAIIGQASDKGPSIARCMSGGLWDAGAGISIGGRHIANWLIGQVRDETQTEEEMRRYAREIGADEEEVVEAFREVPSMSRERFGEVARMLYTLANQLSTSAYQNVQQARFISESREAALEREKLQEQLLQSQKMESVGKLAGGVAHDFNNMLGVILGHTELILDRLNPSDEMREDLEEINKAAKRSAEITRQLLAFARKQTIAPRVLDLNVTLEPMLKMIRRLIGEDIDLAWKPGADLWKVKIDPSQVDQILANLATNARDAVAGVGHVTIETCNQTIDQHYCDQHPGFMPGEYVVLSVSDDGCGIERERMASIFDPFYTTKELGKGTGLGLATVYGIVKQNGGFINVYSEPGHGATFRIYLTRVEESPVRWEAEEAQPLGGSETILVVEDEQASLTLLHRFLTRLGYRVLIAVNPEKALALAAKTEPLDLLLTDVVMPGMNGRQLADLLESTRPNLKRIFMSGYTANVIAHRGVLDVGVDFIQKPYSLKEIAARIRAVLDA